MFDELGHLSQYSKTSFRHWGMKAEWPFAWVERRLALKIGLVAARVVMDGGGCWGERDREWRGDDCVTGDRPLPSCGQPRKSVASVRTPFGEGRVHSHQPQARLSHTTMARTTRSTATTATTHPDKDKLPPAGDDAQSTTSKNKKSKKRKRDSVIEHEDQPATKLARQDEDIPPSPKTEDLQSPPPIISETYLDSDLAHQILETLEMYAVSPTASL